MLLFLLFESYELWATGNGQRAARRELVLKSETFIL